MVRLWCYVWWVWCFRGHILALKNAPTFWDLLGWEKTKCGDLSALRFLDEVVNRFGRDDERWVGRETADPLRV